MPRNPDGSWSRTAGDVAIPLTTIESEDHHNVPHEDIKNTFDVTFWRDGLVAMTGKLILWRDGVEPLEAVSLRQLQAFVDDLQEQIDAIEISGVPPEIITRITNLETSVADIQSALAALQIAVNNLISAFDLLDQRVTALETELSGLTGRVTALESQEVVNFIIRSGIFRVPLYDELPGADRTASPFRIPDLNGVLGAPIVLTADQKAKTGVDKIEWYKDFGPGSLLGPENIKRVAMKVTLVDPQNVADSVLDASYGGGMPSTDTTGTNAFSKNDLFPSGIGVFTDPIIPALKTFYVPSSGSTFQAVYLILECSVRAIQGDGSGGIFFDNQSSPIQLRLRNGQPPFASVGYPNNDMARTDKLITNGNTTITLRVRKNAKNASSLLVF